jgi:hypothetical protein
VEASEVLARLKAFSDSKAVAGMVRFGINPKNTYGVSIPVLRGMAKELGKIISSLQKSGNLESTKPES